MEKEQKPENYIHSSENKDQKNKDENHKPNDLDSNTESK